LFPLIGTTDLLPELPRKNKRKEASFGLVFRRFMEHNPQMTGAFELKQCEKSLPFSAVKPHQIAALKAVKHRTLLWKIADDSRGIKPFDYFYLKRESAYIVIKYAERAYGIDIDDFIKEKGKSLTEERAKVIHSFVI